MKPRTARQARLERRRLACLEAHHAELAEHYEAEGRMNEAREQRINLMLVREAITEEWRGMTP